MRMTCDVCHGTGYVHDQEDHLDVCEKCWGGLGYIEVSPESAPPELQATGRIRRNSFIISVSSIAAFYAVVFALDGLFHFTLIETFLFIFVAYYIGLLAGIFYSRHATKKLGDRAKMGGRHDT